MHRARRVGGRAERGKHGRMTDETPERRDTADSPQTDPVQHLARDLAEQQEEPERRGTAAPPEVIAEVADEMGEAGH